MSREPCIGVDVPRVDAWAKATGAAHYADDLALPGMLHGALLRSPLPHARIRAIDTSRARALPGVKAVITGADLPRVRYGNWRLFKATQDEYALAVDRVRFIGDPVAAVAAVDRETALEALDLIRVDYEELPGLFDLDASLAEGAPRIHEETAGNVSVTRDIDYGDLEAGFARADYVRDDTYFMQPVSHAYLEPCSSLAQADALGRITLFTSTQTPYIVQCLLASALGLRENEVRVVKPHVGGGFGGKMELRSWDVCAAFIARTTGKPVKFTQTRAEELCAGRRRHPMRLRSRVGFTRDGLLTAKELTVHLDGGGYNSMGPTATFLVGNFGAMLYRYPAYRYRGYHVYTNNPPAGAMRGFGAPQALFVAEGQMNEAAAELGIDPIDLRIKNAMRPGDKIPDVATVGTCAFAESLEKVAEMSEWRRKRSERRPGTGIGVGCYSFITGGNFNWFDTKYPFSAAEVRAYADGTVHLLTMAADIGQGSDTVLQQILAAELGLGLADVTLYAADTSLTPKGDLGTWGSRVTFMVGNAILDAARQIKEELYKVVALRFDLNVIHSLECKDGTVRVKGRADKAVPFGEAVAMVQKLRRGEPLVARGSYTPRDMGVVTPTFSFGAQVAEVEVDRDTGKVRVTRIHTAHDCGTPLNPQVVEGQVEGCVQMGLGYALTEELLMSEGRTLNATFLDYKIPGALDMPAMESVCVGGPEPRGPFGAKESGEGPVSPTAPAIAEAVWHATGYRCKELPITPEKVLRHLEGAAPAPPRARTLATPQVCGRAREP
jgi:4-hydroxybenzoyl-CoA reductase alpha subunit